MGGTIRARVRRGLLEPLEKIDLPEGKEVTIAVLESPTLICGLLLVCGRPPLLHELNSPAYF